MPDDPSEAPSSRRRLLVRSLGFTTALATIAWQQRPTQLFKAIFPALPGDAIIVQLPNGQFGLIDGGSDPTALAVELGYWLPFWQREMAFLLLTSADARHLPGQLGALQRYRVANVFVAPSVADSHGAVWRAWNDLLQGQGVKVQPLQAAQSQHLHDVQLHVLAASMNSILIRLSYGRSSIVLAHASDPNLEKELLVHSRLTFTDLLVFPWQRDPHTALVQTLQPRWMHFTAGYQTKTPVQLTYTQRAIAGAQLSHSQLDGTVVWASDGQHSWREP